MEEESNIEKKAMEQEEEVKLTEEAETSEEEVNNGETEEEKEEVKLTDEAIVKNGETEEQQEEEVKITEKVLEEKPAEQTGKKKILIAIDETDFSHYALDWALETLRDTILHSELILLSVAPVSGLKSVYTASLGPAPSELLVLTEDTEEKFAQLILDRAEAICNQHGMTAEMLTELGEPEHVICEKVEKLNIDMLIIGSHGRGPIQRAFLGSVSYYCAHHAKCPVLVVKKPH
jgi:nucleotide-binding universal stress UspA family protein